MRKIIFLLLVMMAATIHAFAAWNVNVDFTQPTGTTFQAPPFEPNSTITLVNVPEGAVPSWNLPTFLYGSGVPDGTMRLTVLGPEHLGLVYRVKSIP